MAMDVGSVFVRLGAKSDRKGFEEFERDVVRAQKVKDISVRLGADVDEKEFALYERKLAETKARVDRRNAYKATLGADYDARSFRAFERDLEKAKRQVNDTNSVFDKLTRSLTSLGGAGGGRGFFGVLLSSLGSVAAAGAKAGEAIGGGGGGLVGAIGALGGAAAAGAVAIGALLAIFAALAGAAAALVGSLGAAAAGLAAIGVGAGAALGPLTALAGAVVQRFGVITEAYKALDTQQSKGAVQAQGVAQAQQAAAQRIQAAQQGVVTAQENVQKAQENLTAARFKARREVQDLAAAVTHAAEAERSASLALAGAQKHLTQVELDPNATLLDRLDAQNGVTQAVQGTTDAHTAHQRALEDRAKGTDTVRVAQQGLADAVRAEARAEQQVTQARQAATVATQKQGAAASDAQQKLAELTSTERHLLTTMQGFTAALAAMFKPATDAIFGGIDGALKSVEPLFGRFTGRFHELGVTIGGIIDTAAKSLAGPEWGRALDAFIATAQKIVKPISDTIGSVLVILRNIAVAAQPLVVDLANNIAKAMGGFAARTGDATKVRDVISTLVDHTKSWFNLMVSAGKLLFTIFSSGAKDGKSLVDWLRQMVDHWNAFLNTREGQKRLHDFFRNAIDLTKKIFTALGDIVGAFLKISTVALQIATHLGGVAKFVKDNTTLVYGLVAAWAAVKTAILLANGAAAVGTLRGLLPGAAAAAGASAAGATATATAGGAAGGGLLARLGASVAARLGGSAALGAGAAAVGSALPVTAVALGGYLTLMNMLEKKSRELSAGFQVATSAAKAFAESGQPEKIRTLIDSIDEWGKKTGATADQIKKLKDVLAGFETAATANIGGVGKVLDQASKHFADFRNTGSNNLHGLHVATQDNMNFIKRTLGEDSAAGKDALAKNFKLAADAVRQAMEDGKVSTRDGLREIQKLMIASLREYGLTPEQARAYLGVRNKAGALSRDSATTPSNTGKAGGGWIGAPGMVGHDTVPAMLGVGEAVLNRHQQGVIEGLLGNGFLDQLFTRVQTPHYLASGGYAGAPQHVVAPRTGLLGSIGRIVQGGLNVATGGANAILGTLGGGGGSAPAVRPGGSAPAGSGAAGSAQVRAWAVAGLQLAGVPASPANVAAMVARIMFESGGNPGAVNLWDSNAKAGHPSKGLVQTIDSTFQQYMVRGHGDIFNPVDNVAAAARYMIARYGHIMGNTGVGYSRGGLVGRAVQGFARGGWVRRVIGTGKPTWGGGPAAASSTSGIDAVLAGNLGDYNAIEQREIPDLQKLYEQTSRRNSLSDEVLIDPKTGALNTDQIQKRADEISALADIQQRILAAYERMRAIARRAVETLNKLVARLSSQLAHIRKGPRHDQVAGELEAYQGALGTWQDKLHDLDVSSIPDAQLSIEETLKERDAVLGTTAVDNGGTSAAAAAPSPDVSAILAQAQAKVDAVTGNLTAANQVIRAFGSPGDIGTGAQNAAGAIFAGAQPMGAQLGTTIAGGGAGGGGGATTINNNFNMPGHPEILRAIGDAATAGQSLQPAVRSSIVALGI